MTTPDIPTRIDDYSPTYAPLIEDAWGLTLRSGDSRAGVDVGTYQRFGSCSRIEPNPDFADTVDVQPLRTFYIEPSGSDSLAIYPESPHVGITIPRCLRGDRPIEFSPEAAAKLGAALLFFAAQITDAPDLQLLEFDDVLGTLHSGLESGLRAVLGGPADEKGE